MTIQEAYKGFMLDRSGYCSEKTLEVYQGHLRVFFGFLGELAYMDFENLPSDLNLFTNYVLYLRSDYSGHITNTSLRSYVRPVKAFLRWCYENDLCVDFLKRVKLPKPDAIPPEPLLQDEVRRLDHCFDFSSCKGLRNYCVVHLMLDCGLRSQEVIKLHISDIDPVHNLLHIRISKECKSRIVMIPDFLLKYILKYVGPRKIGPVFISLRNPDQPLSHNAIKLMFQDLKKASSIPRIHAHLLRHTFATSYLCGGGNLEFLRVLMGHYDYSVTKVYSSLSAQYKMLGVPVYQLDPIFFRVLG